MSVGYSWETYNVQSNYTPGLKAVHRSQFCEHTIGHIAVRTSINDLPCSCFHGANYSARFVEFLEVIYAILSSLNLDIARGPVILAFRPKNMQELFFSFFLFFSFL